MVDESLIVGNTRPRAGACYLCIHLRGGSGGGEGGGAVAGKGGKRRNGGVDKACAGGAKEEEEQGKDKRGERPSSVKEAGESDSGHSTAATAIP